MKREKIHSMGTRIAPAEKHFHRKQWRERLALAALLGAVVAGSAWGLSAQHDAELRHAAEVAQ